MSLNNYYYNVLKDDLGDVRRLDEYIKLMLYKHKMKQKDMAEELGMKATQISRLCKGHKTSYKMIRRLANYFEKDVEFIIKMAIKAEMI